MDDGGIPDHEWALGQRFFSSEPKIQELVAAVYDGTDPGQDRRSTVRVYSFHDDFPPSQTIRYMTHVPIVCVMGDTRIQLQNGQFIDRGKYLEGEYNASLMTPEERVRARRKVIAHDGLMFAIGGYRTPFRMLPDPLDIIFLSIPGNQFEVDYLEYSKFFKVPGQLDRAAYRESCEKDVELILRAFNDMCHRRANGKPGVLRMTALGFGYFARVRMTKDISPILIPIFIDAMEATLSRIGGDLPHVKKVEMMNFRQDRLFALDKMVGDVDVATVHFKEDPSHLLTEYNVGIVNPSDAFSIPGNERGYHSVEAMLGNNSDLRLVQSYFFNPAVLQESHHTRW